MMAWVLYFMLFAIHVGKYSFAKEIWIDPHEDESDLQIPSRTWTDPHDLGVDESLWNNNMKSDENDYCSKKQFNYSHVYMKRLINLLLRSANVEKEPNLPLYSGKLHINIEEEDYIFLKKYVDNNHEECIISLQKLDAIFTKSLAKSMFEEYSDLLSYLGEHLYNMVFNKLTISFSLMIFTSILVYKLIIADFSVKLIIKCFLLIGFIVDFASTFLHLIEAEEIKNIVDIKRMGSIPPECDPSKMAWVNYLSYLFKTDSDCLVYFKATHKNLYYLVTPFKVFSHQFGVLVVGPLASLGSALGAFIDHMMAELPWGLNIVLLPLMLIFICVLLMIISAACMNCSIKVTIFPSIGFEFGKRDGNKNQRDTLTGSNLENILFSHRKIIEDVKEATNKKKAIDAKSHAKQLETKPKRKLSGKKTHKEDKVESLNGCNLNKTDITENSQLDKMASSTSGDIVDSNDNMNDSHEVVENETSIGNVNGSITSSSDEESATAQNQ